MLLCATGAAAQTPPGVGLIALIEVDARRFSSVSEGFDGMALRRGRIGVRAQPTDWLQLRVVGELARAAPTVLDAFASITPSPSVEINVGYLRMPNLVTGRDDRVFAMPLPERSMTVLALGAFRDLGVELHWIPERLPLEAWVRVGNGTGSPLGPEIGVPLGAARLDLVLGRARVGSVRDQSLGLRVGTAASVSVVPDRAGIAGTTSLGFPFYRAVPIEGGRWSWTAHVQAQLGPVQVTVEGGAARDGRSRDTDGNPNTPRDALPAVTTFGLVAEVAWMLTGHHRQGGQWPQYTRPNDRAPRLGAWELSARVERLTLATGASDVTPGGVWGAAAALRWWINPWAALTLAGFFHAYDQPPLEAPDSPRSTTILLRGMARLP